MNPLSFENVDVVNTPLSSLRSCSEYQRIERKSVIKKANSDSVWSIFTWGSFYSKKPTKNRVRFADSHDYSEQAFLVERFRFNSNNLLEDEDYDYSSPMRSWSSSTRSKSSESIIGKELFKESPHRKRKSQSAFVTEASWFVDYLFGYNSGAGENVVMEIELQTLKPPQPLFVYTAEQSTPAALDRLVPNIRDEPRQLGEIRRVTSLGSLERIGQEERVRIPLPEPPQTLFTSPESLVELFLSTVQDQYKTVIERLHRNYRPSEVFYESIRIQPFSSGAYLRGMLLAGISSLFFQVYNLLSWPSLTADMGNLQFCHVLLQRLLYFNLLSQILLNILALPNRLRIHFQCWESSRAVEVDGAVRVIRTMLQGNHWVVNKTLGQALDLLALFNLCVTEFYLWISKHNDPLRPLIVSLCATNLLMFVCRVIVATIFSMSMHDPHVLAEARRRGLSKCDLEVLPTFVYTRREEVNNADCSICLGGFEMGEMLISLPCDKKHSFHAVCIRQWLQRQNSCPLCQKLV